jgi:hypothetical protein
MSISYQQQNILFPEQEKPFIEVVIGVKGQGKVKIPVPTDHPLVTASKKIDWEQMFVEIEPIIYKGINKRLGRKLDLRAHCGMYLLQASFNWTDRFSEEMLRYYAPARIFCGYSADSTRSIDHTKIEKFRNRLGASGAEVMNKHLLKQAVRCNFTNGKDVDMDTTVQEAGISYPTEMNLMKKFRERVLAIGEKVLGAASDQFEGLKESAKKARKLVKEYQLFAKAQEKKRELIEKAREITLGFVEELKGMSTMEKAAELRPYLKKEMLRLLEIMPRLLEQIKSWLETGKVAKDKILSLCKDVPKFISKGKIGKAKEIGRKWIVNQHVNGFLLLICPENPTIADTDCVKISLQESARTFGEMPESYGTDRGMDSKENIKRCEKYGIEKIGIQPRGPKEWQVDQETAREMYCRRAAIEPRIGIAGRLGLKKSRAKTDVGDVTSGHRAGIGFNFKKMMNLWATQIS